VPILLIFASLVPLWHYGNRIHLYQIFGARQAGDDSHCDRRQIGSISPTFLEDAETESEVMALHHMKIPLDNMLKRRPACC